MICTRALLAFAVSALIPVYAMAQDPIHLGAEGYWTVFKLAPAEVGGTTCYIQMNDTRRGRDWAVVISGNMLTGMLFSLGDADGSTKSATSLRITFDGPAMPDKDRVVDSGPKIAHIRDMVATRLNLPGPGGAIDFLAVFGAADQMTVKTNARSYSVPLDGKNAMYEKFLMCMGELSQGRTP